MNSQTVTLHQINLHHSKFANFELFKQTETLSTFIALVQEPHFYKGKLTGTPWTLKAHSNGPNPRASIIHPKTMNIVFMEALSSGDTVSCLWETESEPWKNTLLVQAVTS